MTTKNIDIGPAFRLSINISAGFEKQFQKGLRLFKENVYKYHDKSKNTMTGFYKASIGLQNTIGKKILKTFEIDNDNIYKGFCLQYKWLIKTFLLCLPIPR
jgi:hypothetical protein